MNNIFDIDTQRKLIKGCKVASLFYVIAAVLLLGLVFARIYSSFKKITQIENWQMYITDSKVLPYVIFLGFILLYVLIAFILLLVKAFQYFTKHKKNVTENQEQFADFFGDYNFVGMLILSIFVCTPAIFPVIMIKVYLINVVEPILEEREAEKEQEKEEQLKALIEKYREEERNNDN